MKRGPTDMIVYHNTQSDEDFYRNRSFHTLSKYTLYPKGFLTIAYAKNSDTGKPVFFRNIVKMKYCFILVNPRQLVYFVDFCHLMNFGIEPNHAEDEIACRFESWSSAEKGFKTNGPITIDPVLYYNIVSGGYIRTLFEKYGS